MGSNPTRSTPRKADVSVPEGTIVDIERLAVWTVAVHTVVVTIHAIAHASLQILPAAPDGIFIVITYFVAPVLSAFLLRTRPEFARPLFFLAMLAGFTYGFAYHFFLQGPDNIASVARDGWGLVFIGSTAVLALLEASGIFLGILLLRPPRRTPAPAAGS